MLVKARTPNQIVWTISNLQEFDYDYVSISCGPFDPAILVLNVLGKKCLRVWTGTDVLKTLKFKDYRIRAKIQSYFCDSITEAPWLTEELESVGIEAKTVKHTSLLSWQSPEAD